MIRTATFATALIIGSPASAQTGAPASEFVEAMKACHLAVGYDSIDSSALETMRWRGENSVGGKTRYLKSGQTVSIETERFTNGRTLCRVQGLMATTASDISKEIGKLLGVEPKEVSNGSAIFYGNERSYQLRWTPDNRASITVAR